MDNSLFHGDLVTSQRVIYTPSKFAKSQLIHLQEIGELQARKPHTSQRENLASFLFFLVTSGSGKLVYQKTVYNLQAGDCVFIDCHKSYSHLTYVLYFCQGHSCFQYNSPAQSQLHVQYNHYGRQKNGFRFFANSTISS